MSSITFHPEECGECGECGECPVSHYTWRGAWLCNRPSDWLIPSDDCVMLQQTKWEGVVQMILRNCVYLVQNRPNFTCHLYARI